MWAQLTWLTGEIAELRLFRDEQQWGDDWVWGCVVRQLDGTTAELRLAKSAPPPGGRRAIEHALLYEGISQAEWTRHGNKRRIVKRR